jgi:glycosyltransferase involved in cell wall biosynthesis
MKVLQLCNKPPQPIVDGGCIAINSIAKGLLSKKIDLTILTIATQKHPFELSHFSDDFVKSTHIEGVFVDTRINIIDAFSALVTSDSYNISRFFSADFNKKLIHLLENNDFDIVHLESLFMTPYIHTIRLFSDAKVVLRSHNLEHLIWERLATSAGNKAKKIYLKHLASKLKKYEYQTINEVDGIAAISFEDTARYQQLLKNVPLITIPFGIDLENYQLRTTTTVKPCAFFHIGSMEWKPNEEAVNWLLDEIWPEVAELPITLHLAGRKMPSYIQNQATNNLIVYNEVADAIQFMAEFDVLIAPLLSGGGMRIKIIEAMALGKAVVTTTIGAEGIAYKNGENIWIADTKEEIATAIKHLSENPEKVKELGNNARKLIESTYDNDKIILKLIDFYNSLLPIHSSNN